MLAFFLFIYFGLDEGTMNRIPNKYSPQEWNLSWSVKSKDHWHKCLISFGKKCHAPNPILGFVTMTGMLISSLNLILTRTNLTFSKTFTKASFFLFILVSLLKWYNFPLDIQSIYIVPQRITQSTDYSISKFHIIHLLIL